MASGTIPADLNISKVGKYYNAQAGDVIDTMLDGSAVVALSATVNASLYSALNDTFAYVIQVFYSLSATAAHIQIAFPYSTAVNKIAWRNYRSGAWSSWHVIEPTS